MTLPERRWRRSPAGGLALVLCQCQRVTRGLGPLGSGRQRLRVALISAALRGDGARLSLRLLS